MHCNPLEKEVRNVWYEAADFAAARERERELLISRLPLH